MKKLIVTVDDFGLHPAVNRAVDMLSKDGIVTHTSVLMNGPYLDELQLLKDHVHFGVHLNILRGRPILDPKYIQSIVNSDGYFFGSYGTLFFQHQMGRLLMSEIKAEWRAQIECFLKYGIPISHLDSEKHIHAWPELSDIIVGLAREYDIDRVRYPNDRSMSLRPTSDWLRAFLLRKWSYHFPASSRYTTYCYGIAYQAKFLSASGFDAYCETLNNNEWSMELVCHPGYEQTSDPDIDPSYGRLRVRDMWLPEFDALKDPEWQRVLAKHQIILDKK